MSVRARDLTCAGVTVPGISLVAGTGVRADVVGTVGVLGTTIPSALVRAFITIYERKQKKVFTQDGLDPEW